MSVVLAHADLHAFAQRILEAAGVDPEKAALTASMLVAANLRGVDSHGVQLLSYYVEQLDAGDINPSAAGYVVSERGGSMVYDGENGLGAVVAEQCCRHALRLASKHGLAMVVARHSNHFGMAAFWTRRISAAGHIGIAVCNATPMVPPWQGREPRFGTNPICMSLPGPPEKTWLLDMATTTVAMGKIYNAHFSGEKTIPAGWGLDREGRPTTDPETVMNGGMVAPLGGYKGYGLAMMVEVLCAVLGGGAMSTEVGGIRVRGRPMDVSQTFLAIEVERFLPLSVFQARMERLAGMVKSAPPAAGYDEVLLAGEPEIRIEEQRRRDGIPIPEGTWEALRAVAARLQVPEPG